MANLITNSNKRYHDLDTIRGITLISMIIYHTVWDLVYIFHMPWQWYKSDMANLWQQSICCTFILLSGFCLSMGHRAVKRGLTIFFAGMAITIITFIFTPENQIIFGILTLTGSAMIITGFFKKYMETISPLIGFLCSLFLFFFTRSINDGQVGLFHLLSLSVPTSWYEKGYFFTYLGFPFRDFFSTDYFPILPWIFLFFAGFYLYGLCVKYTFLDHFNILPPNPIGFIGKHSLLIYILHQPIVYGILTCIFS